MDNKTRFIKLSLLAERVNTLGFSIATIAADAIYDGYSIAVVAEETVGVAKRFRQMADECLEDSFDAQKYGLEIILQIELLGLNCMIVGAKTKETKKLLVFGEEIARIAPLCADIMEMAYGNTLSPKGRVCPSSKVITQTVTLLSTTYGGFRFSENIRFVEEIIYGCGTRFENGCYDLRGEKVPIVHLANDSIQWAADEDKYLLILKTGYHDEPKKIGVLIDRPELNCVYPYQAGWPTEPLCDAFYASIIRECWNTSHPSQINFIDWDKLLKILTGIVC